MNRFSTFARAVLALLVVGLIAAATGAPATAGAFEWTDDKDDATQFLAVDGAPNEPSLDIVKTTMSADDAKLTWEIHIAKLAESPAIAPGYFFRFNFDYSGQSFAFRTGSDPIGQTLQFRSATDQVGTNLPCEGCEVKYDLAGSKVVLTAPIKSVIAGIAFADSADCLFCRDVLPIDPLPPVAKGSEFTALEVTASYYYVRTTPVADESPAPEGSTFVL